MENASKALIMAASVLMGIMIMSLAVYLFVTFGSTSRQIRSQVEENRVLEFNSQFTSYEGKDNITIYDVVTVANLATENNRYYELTALEPGNFYVQVILKSTSYRNKSIEKNYATSKSEQDSFNNELIDDDELSSGSSGLPKFSCEVMINQNTGRVNKVKFTKK